MGTLHFACFCWEPKTALEMQSLFFFFFKKHFRSLCLLKKSQGFGMCKNFHEVRGFWSICKQEWNNMLCFSWSKPSCVGEIALKNQEGETSRFQDPESGNTGESLPAVNHIFMLIEVKKGWAQQNWVPCGFSGELMGARDGIWEVGKSRWVTAILSESRQNKEPPNWASLQGPWRCHSTRKWLLQFYENSPAMGTF